jgi:hypothetical protein
MFDKVELDTAFIYTAFDQYNSNKNSDFITSLLIFNLLLLCHSKSSHYQGNTS